MSALLDIVIALFFTYLLLSLFTTAINEVIAGLQGLRAKTLKSGISVMLDTLSAGQKAPAGPSWTDQIFAHPLIDGADGGKHGPSYLHAETFTNALLALLPDPATGNAAGTAPASGTDVLARINKLPPGHLQTSLLSLVHNGMTSVDQAKSAISGWFDRSMDRVSGVYKRRSQIISAVVGAILALMLNADTIGMVKLLSGDSAMRAGVVQAAQSAVKETKPAQQDDSASLKQGLEDLQKVQSKMSGVLLPIGWHTDDKSATQNFPALPDADAGTGWWTLAILAKIIGMLLTCIALTLGAPFWFGMLSTFVNIRNAGPKPAN